jgi:hypothetical protein
MLTYWTEERPTLSGRYWYRNKEKGIDARIIFAGEEFEYSPQERMSGGEWSAHPVGYHEGGACIEEDEYMAIIANPQPIPKYLADDL